MYQIILFTLGCFLTYIFMFFLLPILRKFVNDEPNSRSSHKLSTPTAGGISFILSAIFLNIFVESFNLITLLPLAIIGFLDDKYNIPSFVRYSVQFCTVLFMFENSALKLDLALIMNNSFLLILAYVVAIVLGTGLINFINFMDGIDCLVASTLFISIFFIGLFESNITIMILSGCILGFIPWNFSPAKVFMGDTGSTFLGAYYTSLCYSSDYINAIYLLLIIFPILIDPLLTLLLRFKDKQNIFHAHNLHLYQRLYKGGLKHFQVISIYFIMILVNCIFYNFLNNLWLLISNTIWTLLGIYLNNKFASPFKKKKLINC